jgi:hypothetical protein
MSVVVARRHTTREKAAQTEQGQCRRIFAYESSPTGRFERHKCSFLALPRRTQGRDRYGLDLPGCAAS